MNSPSPWARLLGFTETRVLAKRTVGKEGPGCSELDGRRWPGSGFVKSLKPAAFGNTHVQLLRPAACSRARGAHRPEASARWPRPPAGAGAAS